MGINTKAYGKNIEHIDMTEQARENLTIIRLAGKISELENYFVEVYGDENGFVDEDEIADALHHEWEEIFDYLDIDEDEDDEDNDEDEF